MHNMEGATVHSPAPGISYSRLSGVVRRSFLPVVGLCRCRGNNAYWRACDTSHLMRRINPICKFSCILATL